MRALKVAVCLAPVVGVNLVTAAVARVAGPYAPVAWLASAGVQLISYALVIAYFLVLEERRRRREPS